MKEKVCGWLMIVLALVLISGCVATTMETRTVDAEGNYTVDSTEVVQPAGEPYVGQGTPWFFYNDLWYLNGLAYGCYGSLGWFPLGYYPVGMLVYPNNFYHNPYWHKWYGAHPECGRNFHGAYHGGKRWTGGEHNPHHPGGHVTPGTHGKTGPGTIHRGTGTVNRGTKTTGTQGHPQVQQHHPQQQHPQQQQKKAPPKKAPPKK